MADVVDRNIVVLTPEERHGGEWLAMSEHAERGSLALALGDNPMLHANALAAVRIGPARNVSGRIDSGYARLQIVTNHNAAINGKTGFLRKLETGANPNAGDDEISVERAATLQLDSLAVDCTCRVLELKDHAVLLVESTHEIPHLRTQDALHRALFGCHDMDLDPAGSQRGSHFEPDEARAQHDRAACRLGALDDGAAIGKRTQRAHMRQVGTRD